MAKVRMWEGTKVAEVYHGRPITQELTDIANETYRKKGSGKIVEWPNAMVSIPDVPTTFGTNTYVSLDFDYEVKFANDIFDLKLYRIAGELAGKVIQEGKHDRKNNAEVCIWHRTLGCSRQERSSYLEVVVMKNSIFVRLSQIHLQQGAPIVLRGFTYWRPDELRQ